MPVRPSPSHQITPIAQPLELDAGDVSGRAIALQFTGPTTNWLIANTNGEGPPVWVQDSEVTAAFMSGAGPTGRMR